MAVKGWIDGDETAEDMLSRVLTERPPFLLPPPLHRLPLRVGNVVELVGPSSSSKILILIQAAISCILPKEWKGVHYGGLGRLVLFIDLDCRFDVSCLAEMLRLRIMEANGSGNKVYREQKLGHLRNYHAKRSFNTFYDEELFVACMRRFLYVRCYDSYEFLTTLKTLSYRLKREHEEHGINVNFLLIDRLVPSSSRELWEKAMFLIPCSLSCSRSKTCIFGFQIHEYTPEKLDMHQDD